MLKIYCPLLTTYPPPVDICEGIPLLINTSYLTDSYIGFTLKMESVSKNTIFGLKMMVKSGLEKNILKSLHVGFMK